MGSPLRCPLSCPLFPYMEVVGSLLSCLLSCPLSCPLFPYMEVVGSLICMAKFPWAAHGQPTQLPTCSPRAAKWAAPLFFRMGSCATRSLYASSGPKAESVPTNNQRGRGSRPCRLWGGLRQGLSYSPNRLVSQSATLKELSLQGC